MVARNGVCHFDQAKRVEKSIRLHDASLKKPGLFVLELGAEDIHHLLNSLVLEVGPLGDVGR